MLKQFQAGEYKPRGWLLEQLKIQARGQAGNLDKIWPDVRDSKWVGGDREGWERAPYWLDGFIPLAFLLDDKDMIARAEKYVNAVIDSQRPDGWICPCSDEERGDYDIWALFLICKVLCLYYEFTGSERAINAVYNAMKNCAELLDGGKIVLKDWGKARWFEAFIALQTLYDRCGEEWILNLARRLRDLGTDYTRLTGLWKRPLNKWTFETHIVNLAMMFKFEAVSCRLLGEKYAGKAERLWRFLEKYNGTAAGGFTGDECLAGIANNQGSELCSIVELMYSCEILYAATGNGVWADRLEKLAFNALPATVSDDMWTHQYDQQVNQIACVNFPGKSFFRTNPADANRFGLEPCFGCCTANHGQGWPKLCMNVFLRGGDGIVCPVMLPSVLETEIGGAKVTVEIQTGYPFRLSGKYIVKTDRPVEFPLKIRVPGWAKGVKINGALSKNRDTVTLGERWNGTTEISVEYSDSPRYVKRPLELYTVEYGPLVFSLPIKTEYKKFEYEKDGVERKFPYCDYELYPKSEWRYGYCGGDITVCRHRGDGVPFSSQHPAVTLKLKCARVNWDYADGYDTVAEKRPGGFVPGVTEVEKELYPYGCAKLRITETVCGRG